MSDRRDDNRAKVPAPPAASTPPAPGLGEDARATNALPPSEIAPA